MTPQHGLHLRQGDHLPAQLDETLPPSRKGHMPVAVRPHQIAGAVPVLAVQMQERRGRAAVAALPQITAEHIGAPHQQQACLSGRQPLPGLLHGYDGRPHRRQRLTDGARAGIRGQVEADDRRTFRDAVALAQQPAAAQAGKIIIKALRTGFRPHEGHAQRCQIPGPGLPQHTVQEGGGRHQQGRPPLAAYGIQTGAFRRIGVEDHRHAEAKRQHDVAREAQRMEGRQHGQHGVVTVQGQDGRHVPAVGQDVVMAERHALGCRRRARGEQDGRWPGQLSGHGAAFEPGQREERTAGGLQPQTGGQGGCRIFQRQPCGPGLFGGFAQAAAFQAIQQGPGTEDMPHPGQTQTVAQIARPCGPVQHDRRLSGQQHGQPGHAGR